MPTTQFYQDRRADFQALADRLQARYARLALWRLGIFIGAVAVLILLFSYAGPIVGFVGLLIFLGVFSRFVKFHTAIDRRREHAANLAEINAREAACVTGDWSAFPDGEQYLDPLHPYALDLDIFGPYSFFQFTNRTSTTLGSDRLADYLANPATPEVVTRRQAAVAELSDRLDWRQELNAHGLSIDDRREDVVELQRWLDLEPFVSTNRWLQLALWIVPLYVVIALTLAVLYLPYQLWIFVLVIPGWILYRTKSQVDEVHRHTERGANILAGYAALVEHIEGEQFTSPLLQEIGDAFHDTAGSASGQLRRLAYLIRQLNLRNNFFAIFFNLASLWDLRYVLRLERWRASLREELPKWFEGLAELEALHSLAAVRYNRPEWCFPEFTEAKLLTAEQLGHPLLRPEKRVDNDFTTPTRGHIKLVTGSNMAGKSTFLRSVGMNIVLARTGSVVCAQSMSLPVLEVFTSMRTVDALHEDTSSFYAELKRLKFIIEATEAGRPVYFLLDEILKGTNSRDRHKGSRALIRQLIDARGAGIIATHDLELGDLEEHSNGTVENWRMEVEIEEGELVFDYTLKRGVTQSFNATELMRRMGIRIN